MSAHNVLQDLFKAPNEIVDPGTGNPIVVDRSNLAVPFVIAASASETNTLAAPNKAGVKVTLQAKTVGASGTRTVTVSGGEDQGGDTTLVFDAAGDFVTLESMPTSTAGTYKWIITSSEGITGGGPNGVFDNLTATGTVSLPAGSVSRATLTQETATYNIPLDTLKTHATLVGLGATAGTPSGDCGMTPGAAGSATPLVKGESASGNSKSDQFRFLYTLKPEYVSGGAVTLRVRAEMTGNVNTAQTLDASAYKADGAGGVSSDLVTTNAQAITTSFVDYDFTITPTGFVAGDELDILVTLLSDDTGGTSAKLAQVSFVKILAAIKG